MDKTYLEYEEGEIIFECKNRYELIDIWMKYSPAIKEDLYIKEIIFDNDLDGVLGGILKTDVTIIGRTGYIVDPTVVYECRLAVIEEGVMGLIVGTKNIEIRTILGKGGA